MEKSSYARTHKLKYFYSMCVILLYLHYFINKYLKACLLYFLKDLKLILGKARLAHSIPIYWVRVCYLLFKGTGNNKH